MLAQNVVNADTPGYQLRDLADSSRNVAGTLGLTQTSGSHLPGSGESARAPRPGGGGPRAEW